MLKKILTKILKEELIAHLSFYKKKTITYARMVLGFFAYKKLPHKKRNPQVIVSLTSIPSRFFLLPLVIQSIFRQSILPDRIVLWLSKEYKKFGSCSVEQLPKKLLKLQKKGLEIYWTKDTGSYRKLLPSLKKFPNDIIITIDDDIFYPRNMVKTLYTSYKKYGKKFVYCRRSRFLKKTLKNKKITYQSGKLNFSAFNNHQEIFFTGAGGVLYPPSVLHQEIFNEKVFTKLAPFEDDSWFNAMCRLNKKGIFQVNSKDVYTLPSAQNFPLYQINISNQKEKFHKQLNDVFEYYKI